MTDGGEATARDANRIHWGRLILAVSALAASLFAGAKLGAELVAMLDAAARGAAEPSQSSASPWLQRALDVTKAVGNVGRCAHEIQQIATRRESP